MILFQCRLLKACCSMSTLRVYLEYVYHKLPFAKIRKLHCRFPVKKGYYVNGDNFTPIRFLAPFQSSWSPCILSLIYQNMFFLLFPASIWFDIRRINSSATSFCTITLIYDNPQSHVPSDRIFLDYTKSFDCVPHKKFFCKRPLGIYK